MQVERCLHAGELDRAETLLQALPEGSIPEVHHAWAMLEQRRGRPQQALSALRQSVLIAPEDARWRFALAQVAGSLGEAEEAIQSLQEALRLRPDWAEAWYLLGMSSYGLQRDAEALQAFEKATALQPSNPMFQRAQAESEYALEHYTLALSRFQALILSTPQDTGLLLRLSQCERRCGAPQRALQYARQGVQLQADQAPLWMELGWVLEDLGDAAQALQAYAQAHALQPSWADPLGAMLMHSSASDALVARAEDLLDSADLPKVQRAFLHHALGKRADRVRDFHAAARHWQAANHLRRAQDGGFDRAAFRAQVDAAIQSFDAATLRRLQSSALAEDRPLFVLGMPRSGTTLVEQILASHPQIHGAGERTGIVAIAQALAATPGLMWPQDAARVDPHWLRARAESYVAELARDAAPGARRWVDKQPYNFLHVGLIHLLFSGARVIWCRRDARDVALSIFSENFAPSATYATDLDDIAFVIAEQERLMRHWQAVSPSAILEVQYESLVEEGEPGMRRLLAFTELPWDDACLAFHESSRPVQTLSRWQVRQPLHGRSVGRWRHYPQWFEQG